MTFILTLGNNKQIIQISDRRIVANGQPRDEESDKVGTFVCADARLAFGFTGLAHYGSFNTREWLLAALRSCAPPDYKASNTLQRLTQRLTELFQMDSRLAAMPPHDRRLTLMFSGYLNTFNPPMIGIAFITNFQDFGQLRDATTPWHEFKSFYTYENEPRIQAGLSMIQRVGVWQAMTDKDVTELRELLVQDKPYSAIIDKAVDIIRDMADRSTAQGLIGKQLSSIVVPIDVNEPTLASYHSDNNSETYFLPSHVVAISDTDAFVATDMQLTSVSSPSGESRPLAVKRVGRNRPCPCGSGEKYKKCHGKRL